MICNHDRGAARAVDRSFDEADAVMRTGRVNAFATTIGNLANRERRGEERWKPSARYVSIASRHDPSRDKPKCDKPLSVCQKIASRGIFEIEQAQIIFAALAHDGLVGALQGIGIKACNLLHDLALQIARVGGE